MKIVEILSSDIRKIVHDIPEDQWVEKFEDKPTKLARILIDILHRAPWKHDPKVYNLASLLFKQVCRGKYKHKTEKKLEPYIEDIRALFVQFSKKNMADFFKAEKNNSSHHKPSVHDVRMLSHGKQKIDKKNLKKREKVKYSGKTWRFKKWVWFRDNGSIRKQGFSRSKKSTSERIFVVDAFGQFYISKEIKGSKDKKAIKHSTFFRGEPVAAAGTIQCNRKGKIVKITNDSGHYKPGKKEMRNALLALKRHGEDLSQVKVEFREGKKKRTSNAADWNLEVA